MRIMLACALGLSTGMLMEKMRDSAASEGKDYTIWAVDVNSIEANVGKFDVLLLGPQVVYLLNDMKKKYGQNAAVEVIKTVDYGRMNGKGVVKQAEKAYEEFKKNA